MSQLVLWQKFSSFTIKSEHVALAFMQRVFGKLPVRILHPLPQLFLKNISISFSFYQFQETEAIKEIQST